MSIITTGGKRNKNLFAVEKQLQKTADILRHQHWLSNERMSEDESTDDLSLPGLALTNQKPYPDLGSDTSSVWNFCVFCSDIDHFEVKPVVASQNVGCFLRQVEINITCDDQAVEVTT